MKKTYVLDTSVLMHDSSALYRFEENKVVISSIVLNELDNLKSDDGIKGFKARRAIKEIARYLDNTNGYDIEFYTDTTNGVTNDDKIINVAYRVNGILVTRDLSCRVKATSLGVKVDYYKTDNVDVITESIIEIASSKEVIDKIYKEGVIEVDSDLYENQAVILKSCTEQSALGIYSKGKIYKTNNVNINNIKPADVRQQFALQYLVNDNIPLCVMEGRAGTGKSFLALNYAIEGVVERRYRKILIAKPIVSVGGDSIGYLPGRKEEKLSPWMGCVFDNLEQLGYNDSASMAFVDNIIELLAIEHIRGRSLKDCCVLIDECQNISSDVLRTILTRAGSGTKVIVCGDISQIDTLYLTSESCGLSRLISKTLDSPLVSYIRLEKCVRSQLADYIERVL